MAKKKKILIVDDHPTVSFGTRMILEKVEGVEVIGIAESGKAAMECFLQEHPDIIFLDLHLPDIEGLEVAKKMKTISSEVDLIIFTGMDYFPILGRLLSVGISGVLTKDASAEQMIRLVERVKDGETIIPIEVFKQLQIKGKGKPSGWFKEATLTEKEEHILVLVSKGYTNHKIAKEIFMTTRSVEYYLTRIYEKLNVKSRAEAVEKFLKTAGGTP